MSIAGRAVACALTMVVALAACSSDEPEPPRPGDALDASGLGLLRRIELPPGQEVIALVPALRNESDAPLEITKLRAFPGAGVPALVQIVQVSLLPREAPQKPGVYVTFPPVTRKAGRCARADVRAPGGETLEPNGELLALIWLRAIDDGVATVQGLRATYEQRGTTYEQEVLVKNDIVVEVAGDTVPITPRGDERACADDVRFLPGSVRF